VGDQGGGHRETQLVQGSREAIREGLPWKKGGGRKGQKNNHKGPLTAENRREGMGRT